MIIKKLGFLVLVTLLVSAILLGGCNSSSTTSTSAATSSTTTTKTTVTTPASTSTTTTKTTTQTTTPSTTTSSSTTSTTASTTTSTTASTTTTITTSTIPATTITTTSTTTTELPPAEFILTAAAFTNGQPLPVSCAPVGGNKSPALAWSGAPAGTVSFVLLVEDMDAGNFCHWVVFNIGADTTGLAEDMPKVGEPGNGVRQGNSSWGTVGWGGPTPPPGTGAHRYYFRLYALDTTTNLPAGVRLVQVREAMEGHILDTAELMGTFRDGQT